MTVVEIGVGQPLERELSHSYHLSAVPIEDTLRQHTSIPHVYSRQRQRQSAANNWVVLPLHTCIKTIYLVSSAHHHPHHYFRLIMIYLSRSPFDIRFVFSYT